MSDCDPPVLSTALDQLWIKFLPQNEERVAALRKAMDAYANGGLSDEQLAGARGAAHKLAGTLGTFGLPEGTRLAREAEQRLSQASGLDSVSAARVSEIATELQRILTNR